MNFRTAGERYLEDGYFVPENCVPSRILEDARAIMEEGLRRLLQRQFSLTESIYEAVEIYRQFDVQHFVHQELQARRIKRRILLHEEILEHLIHLIGPDLAYNRAGSIVFNILSVDDPLYQKKWHQEVWSGACVNEVRVWLPLLMASSSGGVEFIPGSHKWGMVPNKNREPTVLPEGNSVVAPEVREGSAIFFHPLTLHRTVPNLDKTPRVALTMGVRNIYYPYTGQSYLQSWQPFHFSAVGQVQKTLGNPFLTPFRTLGGSLSHVHLDDGKKDIPDILD